MPQGAVFKTVNRQARAFVRVLGSQLFIDIDTVTRCLTWCEVTIIEAVGMREDFIHLLAVAHMLLNTKIRNPVIEMKGCAHTHWRQVCCTVAAGAHVEQRSKIGDTTQVSDTSGVHDGCTD